MSKSDIFINNLQASWHIIRLTKAQIEELKDFILLFDDFFLLCEGEKGSAESLLEVCPSSKDATKDKFVLGIYDDKKLIGVIDLIQNYPTEGTWTIGYLLIHPAYRRNHLGYNVIKDLGVSLKQLGVIKLRCGVQEQNTNALMFWQKCNFEVVKMISETLGKSTHQTYVLEKPL